MQPPTPITFPVYKDREALRVTDLNFKIEPDETKAYVNLDDFRDTKYRQRIFSLLDVADGEHHPGGEDFKKVLFSGHPGSGKTLELERLHHELDHGKRFTAIYISLEEQVNLDRMQPEDFYILLVTNLAERMQGYDYKNQALQDIAKDWLSDKEIVEEVERHSKLEVSAEASVGGSFFLKLKSGLKSTLMSHSKGTERLRRKVRENSTDLIKRFNLALNEARSVTGTGLGRDFLFIMDGSEKASLDLYEKIFVKDSYLIRSLACHAIFSVPIKSYFDIEKTPKLNFFDSYTLPMIRIGDASRQAFGEIVRKRMDVATFIEEDALALCVEQSGGVPRQLLRIVNLCLLDRVTGPITQAMVAEVCRELGQQLRDLLRSDHVKALRSGDFNNSDGPIIDMLYQLIILKYNGHRELNPLLQGFGLVDEN